MKKNINKKRLGDTYIHVRLLGTKLNPICQVLQHLADQDQGSPCFKVQRGGCKQKEKDQQKKKKLYEKKKLSTAGIEPTTSGLRGRVPPTASHLSPLTPHPSPLTSHLSPLTSHLSLLTFYKSIGIRGENDRAEEPEENEATHRCVPTVWEAFHYFCLEVIRHLSERTVEEERVRRGRRRRGSKGEGREGLT